MKLCRAAAGGLILALAAADREAIRGAWHERFQNRKPPTGDRQPGNLAVQAGQIADTTEILLFDEIGFWGVTAKEFAEKLAEITTPNILVRINSPGGDVFDGFAIYSALQSHPARIETRVEGLAASAASFIALAGERVTIAEAAMMMIHKAWGLAIGNADDMVAFAATLEKIDGNIAGIYAKKTKKTRDEMMGLMAAETWLDADESVAMGLADEIMAAPAADDDKAQSALNEADRLRVAAMRRRLALAAHDD